MRATTKCGGGVLIAALSMVALPAAGIPEGPMPQSERIEISVGGMVFDARVAGPEDGPLVLLLHGFPQSSYGWRAQIPVLAGMGLRVVAPDQRGYSPGARPEAVEEYAIPELVGDVVAIADALGADSFHLVGHDWGAAVAWLTAMRHPRRVTSLVAVSTPHPFAFRQALEHPNGEQARMSGYMDVLRSEQAEELLLADDAAMLRSVYTGAGLSESDIRHYVDLLGTPEALGAALNWYRAMVLPESPGTLTPIAMPTMFVWSTGDTALGRTGAEMTADFVQGPYRFEVLEGVSHWIPEQAAETLNRLLSEHFEPFVR